MSEISRWNFAPGIATAQTVAHVGSWTSGLGEMGKITWSAECYRIFGVPRGTAMSVETFVACVFPADREHVARASRDAVACNLPYDIEHRVLRPDGQVCMSGPVWSTMPRGARADVMGKRVPALVPSW